MIFQEKMRDFRDKWGILEEKMGDFGVKWGIFSKRKCMIFGLHGVISDEKLCFHQVKWGILKEKMHDLGGKCGIFQVNMRDLGLNGGFWKRKCMLFEINRGFL